MLIGIDGNEANQVNRVGVGQYGFQLLTQFYKKPACRQAWQKTKNRQQIGFTVYLKEPPLKNLPKETEWWQYKVIGPKFLWTQIGLPVALLQVKPVPDVFFTPTHYAPRFSPCPRLISIMDLSYIHFPEMFKKRDLWKLERWTAYSVSKARKILAISESTKDDIIKYYQIEPEKVVVIYPGMDKKLATLRILKNMENTEKIKKKYGIEGDYILYVGTLQPRKNLVRLIEAFNITIKQYNNITIKLVIAGKKGWLYEEIFQRVKDLGLKKEVIFTGYVPDKDLPALYKGAKCFVLVSLYEGFGLPALEALSFGVPVVVSKISSLPEVVGNAGVLVDPHDVKDIVKGINEVLNYTEAERQEMIRRGLKQAKKFSWEKCAKETLEVLTEVGSGN